MYFAGSHSLYTPPIPSRAVSAPPPPMFVPATSYGPPTPVQAPVTPPTPPLSSIGPSPDQLLRGIIPFPPISVGPFSVPAGITAAPPPSNFFPSEHPTTPQPFSIPAGIAAAPPPSNIFPSERPTSQQPFSVPAGIAAAPPPSNFFPTERPTPPQPFSIPAGIAAAPPPSNFLTFVSPPPIRAQSAPTGITLASPKELVLSPGSRIEIRDELGQYSHGLMVVDVVHFPSIRWGSPPWIQGMESSSSHVSYAGDLKGVAVSGGAIFSEFWLSSSSTLVPDGFLHITSGKRFLGLETCSILNVYSCNKSELRVSLAFPFLLWFSQGLVDLYGFNAFQLRLVPFCSVYVTQVKKLRLNEVAFVESTREVIEVKFESTGIFGFICPSQAGEMVPVITVDGIACGNNTLIGLELVTFSDQNGTTVSEQGHLTLTNEGWESVIVKEGSYSYISPEGIPVSVSYIADEKGFRATGSHLPNVVLVKGR
uniref:Uncharacterized protein n=1 Tax=Timema bartmani TaxID=61472 RepID=A0A7R9ETB2_9NEOP|nr:unnamed protein product [Timema bartmani]